MMKVILSQEPVLNQNFRRKFQLQLKADISVCQPLVYIIRVLFLESTRQRPAQTWDTPPASAQASPAMEIS